MQSMSLDTHSFLAPTFTTVKCAYLVDDVSYTYLIDYLEAITRSLKQLTQFYKVPSQFYSFSTTEMSRPVEKAITTKLTSELNPSYLDVINESYLHNVPKDSESHFKVVVVSKKFEKLPLIQRHRLVNEILGNELANSIHALSIQAKTPEQWEASGGKVNKSPPCLGGFGR